MLRVFETFSGIGAQRKALEFLKQNKLIDYKILATSEWDMWANISYNAIHFNNDTLAAKNKTKEEMLNFLEKFDHSKNSKEKVNFKSIKNLPNEIITKLYSAYKNSNNLGSITKIDGSMIATLDVNMITYSFPCQDLSSAGKNEGMNRENKTRSSLLWEIDRILNELKEMKKLPKFLMLENVRNMISDKHKQDFISWITRLHDYYGYNTQTFVLDASEFGIPQKRKRVYAISILDEETFVDYWTEKKLIKSDPKIFRNPYLLKIENFENKFVEDLLKIDYKNLLYKKEAKEAIPNWTPSRKEMFYDNPILFLYSEKEIEETNKNDILSNKSFIKKENLQKQFNKFIRTITTKQDRNPNAGQISLYNTELGIVDPIINQTKSNYRFLTPRETFLFMGFSEIDFERVIENKFINKEKLYRQAGNSIVVNVLVFLFFNIYEKYGRKV